MRVLESGESEFDFEQAFRAFNTICNSVTSHFSFIQNDSLVIIKVENKNNRNAIIDMTLFIITYNALSDNTCCDDCTEMTFDLPTSRDSMRNYKSDTGFYTIEIVMED
ncbi:hypothetical protein E24_00283 [Faustovirus]|nr:hypothetical protein PRJ_Fausto_00268 [Faustovirus]AMN83207.1 hypothetical protein E24_00283 [Faustovirus]AMN85176.1 hypothetical protein E23_00282 [Faustovirus]QBR99176.1 hypothetical protein [Faustovirus mariensis]